MGIKEDEYFFIEWLIIAKGIDLDKYKSLTRSQYEKLRQEWHSKYGS